MDEERFLILKMLEEGKISSEEASALLDALEGTVGSGGSADASPGPGPDSRRRRWFGGRHGWDPAGFDCGMEDFRREIEKIRLRAMDIGDEISRRVQETVRDQGSSWRDGGPRSLRNFMRDIGDVFNVPFGREMHEETYEREIAVEAGVKVEVKDLSGDVKVEAWERDAVAVKAVKRVWAASREEAKARAADYQIAVEQSGDAVYIGAQLAPDAPGWLPARCTIDYQVRVPAGAEVRVLVTNGEVEVSGVRGGVELRSTNGKVVATSVGGHVSATSTNGDLALRAVDAKSLTAKTVNGDVDLDLVSLGQGDHSVNAARGDVTVRLPAGLRLDLRASTMHGDLSLLVPATVVSRSATRLEARLGPSADSEATEAGGEKRPGLEVRTMFGDLTVAASKEGDGK